MRTHGWGGQVPADDDEAISRIIEATRATIDSKGEQTGIADVARHLGVTRQTVYRYFRNTEDLLSATALQATEPFLATLARELRSITDPAEAIIEGIVTVIDRLPHERYLGLLLRTHHTSSFAVRITSPTARHFGRSMIMLLGVDWAGAGFTDTDIDDIVEIVLRTIQSLILDPGDPERTADELRAFLYKWILPTIESMAGYTDPRPSFIPAPASMKSC
ncbi:TetR/AcrR family transcriptional regulator [Antrihabitans sp. YC2-6]|uniref:TetR/AcrR family transcriptional regulator n=1 Tax=Antrihabitans sp. YC2-6 TaxID=2799498 RepID=UPI0018F5FCCC|nr:TetR/AcrR family transcriptional regulator [Antrihabitans sp. YC2-6]MBJ8345746.1 TetR/AcrR family transcriptional regulator [Antrihabitans sp. YC2-6]